MWKLQPRLFLVRLFFVDTEGAHQDQVVSGISYFFSKHVLRLDSLRKKGTYFGEVKLFLAFQNLSTLNSCGTMTLKIRYHPIPGSSDPKWIAGACTSLKLYSKGSFRRWFRSIRWWNLGWITAVGWVEMHGAEVKKVRQQMADWQESPVVEAVQCWTSFVCLEYQSWMSFFLKMVFQFICASSRSLLYTCFHLITVQHTHKKYFATKYYFFCEIRLKLFN